MLLSLLRNVASRGRVPADPQQAESPFFDHLMSRFFAKLGEPLRDNFDCERYSVPPGSIVSFNPDYAHHGFRLIHDHAREIEQVLNLFEDETSRVLYEDLLLYRMLGHTYMRLPANNPQHWAMREAARQMRSGDSSCTGAFGPLERFRLEFEGESLDVQCYAGNVAWSFLMRQYYFDRDGIRIQASTGDYVIDAGACYGDTALGFAAATGTNGRVFAFDIMPLHMQVSQTNLASDPALAPRIELVEAALADRDDVPLYIHGRGPGARVSATPSQEQVRVSTIDKYVAEHGIPRIDFIKMDIEGAEGAALAGAVKTMRRWRARLAISLNHQPTDIFRVPLYLDSLGLGYKFYLDHYTIHHEETVLYAVPRS